VHQFLKSHLICRAFGM